MSATDQKAIASSDRQKAQADVEPLSGKLTLAQAVARALKYNLDHRTRLMEEALAVGQLEVGRFDMLPKLTAAAGYTWRDSDYITRSTDSVTGLPSLANPYISADRSYPTYELGLSWNLLDFGVSYYNAKQNADRVLIASERRRKAMHLLVQDVRTAFWRAASAEKLRDDLRATIKLAESALEDSRRAEIEQLRNPIDALRYQRTVLESLRILHSIERDLASSRIELASLINLPPGATYEIAEPALEDLTPARLDLPLDKMEEIAVENNAELREHFYNARIAVAETRKAMLRMFPGISFNYGPKYSGNSYLINQHWQEAGTQVTWNLLSLLSAPANRKVAEDSEMLAEHKRMAMQMAVLSQVHLSSQQYENAYTQFVQADAIWKVDQRIYQHSANRVAADNQTRLESISNNTSAIVSLLRRYQALSQVYAAGSKVQATLGLEPVMGSVTSLTLADLTGQAELAMRRWSKGDGLAPAPAGSNSIAAPGK